MHRSNIGNDFFEQKTAQKKNPAYSGPTSNMHQTQDPIERVLDIKQSQISIIDLHKNIQLQARTNILSEVSSFSK